MTLIYRNTRIATIIKANKDSIEAIASVAKVFEKLRNPLLRKVLAPRATLEDAARIGGCRVEDIVRQLAPLGFVLADSPPRSEAPGVSVIVPEFIRRLTPEKEHILDVRADLQAGNDPLKKIMQEVERLVPGQALKIINTFEPIPLITLLERKGFESYVKPVSDQEIHIYFYLQNVNNKLHDVNIYEVESQLIPPAVFREKLAAFGDHIREVDVRDLEMAQPMITILESLSVAPAEHALLVIHKRIPVFLFDELKERNYRWLVCRSGDTEVQLLIFGEEAAKNVNLQNSK